MAIEQSGIKLTADVQDFISGIERVNKDVADMIRQMGAAEKVVSATGLAFNQFGRGSQFTDPLNKSQWVSTEEVINRVKNSIIEVMLAEQRLATSGQASGEAVHRGLAMVDEQGRQVVNVTRQLIETYGQLGLTVDKATGKWTSSSKQQMDSAQAVNQATEAMRNKLNELGQTGVTVSQKMTKSQSLIAAAQGRTLNASRNLAGAEEVAARAIADAAEATDDKTEKEKAAVAAILDLIQAQNKYNAAVANEARVQEEQAGTLARLGGAWGEAKNIITTVTAVLSKVLIVFTAITIAVAAAAKAVKAGIDLMINAFKLLASPITHAIDRFKQFIATIQRITFGVIVRDTVRSIARELRLMGEAAVQAASDFQVLTIRLESMETRLVGQVRGLEDYSDALAEGSVRGQAMLRWIKQLSLTAPFDVKAIADTVALNMAMGFGEKQTKSLTTSMLSYAAAMGLGSEHMERMVFNFGQMKAAGKVTSTELRDLARGAFLPLSRISEEMGRIMGDTAMSIQEVKEAAAEGTLPVEVFFQAFENMVARDFPGALEKFSNTLVGVKTRFVNFMKTIVGLEVLGPTVQRITTILNAAIDKLLSPEVLEKAAVFGKILLRAFDLITTVIHNHFLPAIKNVAEALGLPVASAENLGQAFANIAVAISAGIKAVSHLIEDLARWISNTFTTMGKSAFEWGAGIIESLARGMAAAVAAVLRVIRFIANAIASLFRSKSPPKILPDLPKWGKAAMESYLEGWGDADVGGILEKVKEPIKKAIETVASSAKEIFPDFPKWDIGSFTKLLKGFTLGDFDVLEGVQGPLERALRILVDTGKITEKEMGRIFANISEGIAKVMRGEMSADKLFEQIRKTTGPFGKELAELARRQIELAAATDAVAEAEKKLADARKREEEARKKVAKGIREYNALLRAGASESVLRNKLALINADEEAAAAAHEDALAAEDQLKAAEEKQKKWEELVTLQEKLVEQLLKLIEIQIVPPEVPEEGGGGGGGGAGAGGPLDDLLEDLEDLADLSDLLPTEEEIRAKIDEMFNTARTTVEGWIKQISDWFAPIEEEIQPTVDSVIGLWETMQDWWDQNGPGITQSAEDAWVSFGMTVTVIGTLVGQIIDNLKIAFFGLNGELEQFNLVSFIIDTVTFAIWERFGFPLVILAGILENITGKFRDWRIQLDLFWLWVQDAGKKVEEWIDRMNEKIDKWGKEDSGFSKASEAIGEIKDALTTLPSDIVLGIINAIVTFGEEAGKAMAGATEGIKSAWTTLGNELIFASIIPDILDAILTEFTEVLGQVIDYLSGDFSTGVTNLIDGALTDLETMFVETLYTAVQAFKEFALMDLQDYIDGDFTTSVDSLVDPTLSGLNDYIDKTLSPTIKTFTSPTMENLARTFDDLVISVSSTISRLPALNLQFQQLKAAVDAVTAAVRALIEAIRSIPDIPSGPKVDTPSATVRGMALSRVNAPIAGAGFGGAGNTVNLNMGGVGIYNAMDEAVFAERVISVIKRSIA